MLSRTYKHARPRKPLGRVTVMIMSLLAFGILTLAMISPGLEAPLPDNRTKEQGTVTCTTFEGPGNNQAGVGTTTSNETQGNTSNTSPEPQDLESSQSCKPPTSNGAL